MKPDNNSEIKHITTRQRAIALIVIIGSAIFVSFMILKFKTRENKLNSESLNVYQSQRVIKRNTSATSFNLSPPQDTDDSSPTFSFSLR